MHNFLFIQQKHKSSKGDCVGVWLGERKADSIMTFFFPPVPTCFVAVTSLSNLASGSVESATITGGTYDENIKNEGTDGSMIFLPIERTAKEFVR